jgi:hypothetical protein
MTFARCALAVIAAISWLGSSSSTQAQTYRNPNDVKDCIHGLYDPNYYNWYAFQNTCDQPMKVTYRAEDGSLGLSGSVTVQPGRKASTGNSASEVRARGGISFAVCPAGYLAVDANGRLWSDPNSGYKCKKD